MTHHETAEIPPRPRSPIVPLVHQFEQAKLLDSVADRLDPLASPTTAWPRLYRLLRGDWLGHAVHPLLTDFPLGAWTCTSLLDLFGGHRARPAAKGLLAFGLFAAVPTAITGAAEWITTTDESRRLGAAHAVINLTAFALYGTSLAARLRERHARGVCLGLLGGLTATVGGYFGGHLSIAKKVGTSDPTFGAKLAGDNGIHEVH
jgi:uncharacterized membrane protein